MKSNMLHVTGENLEHLTELALVRGENAMLCEFIGHSPRLGVVSAMLLTVDQDDLETVAAAIDGAALQATPEAFLEDLPYSVVQSPIDPALATEALTGRHVQISGDYPEDQIQLLGAVAARPLPDESFSIFHRLEDLSRAKLMPALRFLTSGDQEARRQALESYPILAETLVEGRKFHTAIDERRELAPLIADHLQLSPAGMRVYARLERAMADLSFAPDNPEGSTLPRMATNPHRGVVPVMAHIHRLATEAARRIRVDQLPAGRDQTSSLDAVSALRCIDQAKEFERMLGTGPAPIDRILKRVKPGQWAQACERLKAQQSKMKHTRDYLQNTAKSIRTAILVERLRSATNVDMHRISASAHQVLSDNPLSEADAAYLSRFATVLSALSYKANSLISPGCEIIGQHASLKTLSEADTRWHHIQQRISNELMATSEDIQWEPIQGNVVLEDVVARELASSSALIEQGRKENHCVGSYARQVLGANSGKFTLIFSIDDPDGNTLSTVEIMGKKTLFGGQDIKYVWSIEQHQARGNTAPSLEATAAADQLIEHLSMLPAAAIRSYVDRITSDPANMKDKLARMINAFGANICDPDLPERTCAAIASTMPPSLRGKTAADWLELLEASASGRHALEDLDALVAAANQAFAAAAVEEQPEYEPQ